jgi:rSAM/selenodomain-associated transferase 2
MVASSDDLWRRLACTVRRMRLSVIVPALDEEHRIEAALRSARQPGVHEIVVADGGSRDDTRARAAQLADRVVETPQGRAVQMNAGARASTGDVLLFLHADTLLPQGFPAAVARALADPDACGGRFDVELTPQTPLLWLVGALMNVRSRVSRIATGDQALFVRRETFARLGGFAEIPLMEDIDFSRRLKRAGRVVCLRERVATSSRRWIQGGPLRTILLMWMLRLLYFCGVPPGALCRLYTDRR